MCSIRPQRCAIGIRSYKVSLETFLGLTGYCRQRRWNSTTVRIAPKNPPALVIDGTAYATDSVTNATPTILENLGKSLHLQESHPICITRQIIESKFPDSDYTTYNLFPPVVSAFDNFDSLCFPPDHPGRSRSDTYYINRDTVLRTHTSAHQAGVFRSRASQGFLISGDVYRRDAIDRSHYPVFHQMEGARTWSRSKVPNGDIVSAVKADLHKIPKIPLKVEDPNPVFHQERNPKQAEHLPGEVEAIAAHLKRTLEGVVFDIFSRAEAAGQLEDRDFEFDEGLRMRWVEASFPFTSPSWELEIFWQQKWLEVLGCGVVQHSILKEAKVPDEIGWAFGIGLERIAMKLFEIPDIRLFWSTDPRFLDQFENININAATFQQTGIRRFVPFSKYPSVKRDISFWLPGTCTMARKMHAPWNGINENDITEVVRENGGDLVESCELLDEFNKVSEDGKRVKTSLAFRLVYRSLERTLQNAEVQKIHNQIEAALVEEFKVQLRG